MRSRVSRRALATDAEHEQMIEQLVKARLVTSDEDAVELAHEAIARAWPRLRGWLDDDAEGQRIRRHLSMAAGSWEAMGQPASELYRGARLAQAIEWRDRSGADLNPSERAFLDASQHHIDAERVAARRRRRAITSAIAAAAVVAVLLGAVAVVQARRAASERDRALSAEDDARLEALVNRSLALRSTDRAVAALLAVEANRRAPGDPRAHSALLGTFTAAPGFAGYVHLPEASLPLSGDIAARRDPPPSSPSPGATCSSSTWRPGGSKSGSRRWTPIESPRRAHRMSTLRVSADGRYVAQLVTTRSEQPCFDLDVLRATDDAGCAALLVYDITSGEPVLGPVTPPVGPGDLALNADGSLVAVAGGYDGKVAVYRTGDGELVGVTDGVPRPPGVSVVRDTATVVFGADGRLYAGSLAGPVRVIDPSTTEVVGTIDAPAMATNTNLIVTGSRHTGR